MSAVEDQHLARIKELIDAASTHLYQIKTWYNRDTEEAFESAEELASVASSLEGRLRRLLDLQSQV
jgi:hypothetical protein